MSVEEDQGRGRPVLNQPEPKAQVSERWLEISSAAAPFNRLAIGAARFAKSTPPTWLAQRPVREKGHVQTCPRGGQS